MFSSETQLYAICVHARVTRCLNIALCGYNCLACYICQFLCLYLWWSEELESVNRILGFFEKGKVDKFIPDLCVKRLRDVLMENGYLLKIVIWSLCVLKVAELQTVFSGLTRKSTVEAFLARLWDAMFPDRSCILWLMTFLCFLG